jgi:hypothetical protein
MAVTITITADAQGAIRVLQQLEGVMSDVGQAAETASDQTSGGFASAIQGAGDFVFAAQNVVGAVTGMADAIGDFAQGGAKIQRAKNALIAFSGGAEEAEMVLTSLRGATAALVSDFDLMTSGARFMSMGIAESADEAAELAEIAVTLGASLGRGPNEAMEEFALLMANESIPRLDTFGISAGKVRKRIQELLDTGQALNRSEAFRMAVIEDAVPKVAALGGAANIAGGNIERFRTTAQNAMDDFASVFSTVIDDAIGILFQFGEALGDAIDDVLAFFGLDIGIPSFLENLGSTFEGVVNDIRGLIHGVPPEFSDVINDITAELERLELTEAQIHTIITDPETPETIQKLMDIGFDDPALLAVTVAQDTLNQTIETINAETATIADIMIAVGLEDPTLTAVIEELARFDDWPPAEIAAALQSGGLQQVIAEIEDRTNYPPAEITAIIASGGFDEINAAIQQEDYDPAQTTVIVAQAGLEPVQDTLSATEFAAEAGITIPPEKLAELDAQIAREELIAEAEAHLDTAALRGQIEAVGREPVFVAIMIDETQFDQIRAELEIATEDLGVDPVLIDATVSALRLRTIREELEEAGADLDLEYEMQLAQTDAIRTLLEEAGAELPTDVEITQESIVAAADAIALQIGDEQFLLNLGYDREAVNGLLDGLENEAFSRELLFAASFDPTTTLTDFDTLAQEMGADPVEVRAAWEQGELDALIDAAEGIVPEMQIEAILQGGTLESITDLIVQSGISSIDLELALSDQSLADVQARLAASPLAATVFIDDQSIFDMQMAMEDAGIEIPATFNVEDVSEQLRAAGIDELAIAAFVEEESIAGIRGQLEGVGVDDVIIDVVLAGGATEQAQMIADNLVAAANAAERMEAASQGISEALGVTDVTGLTRDIEDAFAAIVGPEGEIELGLALGTTTDAEQALNELLETIETAGLETEQEVELAVALRAAMETGQVNEALLNEINTAIAEGDFELAIDIAANFAESASPEAMGVDLTLATFTEIDGLVQGWMNTADPATLGADQTEESFANIQNIVTETRYFNAISDSEAILANARQTALILEGVNIGGGNGNGTPQSPEQQGGFE